MALAISSLGALLPALPAEAQERPPAPDLILFNGTVLTMDGARSTGQAVAIRGDRIAAVGSDSEVRALATKSTRMLDLQGKAVLPGFIDSRVLGPFGFWEALHGIRLIEDSGAPMATPERVASAVKDFLAANQSPAGQWLVAAGFDSRLDGTRRFGREWADELAPNHPLLMLSLDHHVALLNTKAIELLGLKTSSYPAGSGQVERDAKGEPTGVLRELPVFLVMNQVWEQVPATLRREAMVSFLDAAGRFGITTVGTPFAVAADLETAEALLKDHEMPIRLVAGPLGPNENARQVLQSYGREGKSPDADHLQVGPPVYPVDGSMLSGKAALFQPYTNAPWTSGALSMTPDAILDLVKNGAAGADGLVLDASGSMAVHLLMEASERNKAPAQTRTRPVLRIDGMDLIEGSDRARLSLLAESGWVVSLQPTRLPYQIYVANAIGEERMKEALPYRSLVDAGIKVAINSNWPMSAPTFQPTQILKWAVARSGLKKEEALSMEQALRAYTVDAAGALGLGDKLGSIEVGKKADLVVLDRNPLDLANAPETLPDVPVRMTIASGTVVFEDRKTASATPQQKGALAAMGKSVPATPALPAAAQD